LPRVGDADLPWVEVDVAAACVETVGATPLPPVGTPCGAEVKVAAACLAVKRPGCVTLAVTVEIGFFFTVGAVTGVTVAGGEIEVGVVVGVGVSVLEVPVVEGALEL